MEEFIRIAETHGFAWLLALIAIWYGFKRIAASDKVIENNTAVTEEFRKFLSQLESTNKDIVNNLVNLHDKMDNAAGILEEYRKLIEKIFTQAKLNEKEVIRLLDRIDGRDRDREEETEK